MTPSSSGRAATSILRAAAVAVLATVFVLVVPGCGIPGDSQPRLLEGVQVAPVSTPTPTPQPEVQVVTVTVYLLDAASLLAGVSRDVEAPVTPERLMAALVAGPDDEDDAAGRSSAIPQQTELIGARQEGDTLVLDLAEGGLDLGGGQELRRAIAQIVYTITEIDGIERVRILVNGTARPLPLPGGPETNPGDTVTRADYEAFDPRVAALATPTPAPG